jgi:hypothetical protein
MAHLVMREGVLVIDSTEVTAKLLVTGGRVQTTHPVLLAMNGWTPDEVLAHARRKGWMVTATFGPPEPEG